MTIVTRLFLCSAAMLAASLAGMSAHAAVRNYAACIAAPLPAAPKSPNWRVTVTGDRAITRQWSVDITVWRENCAANPNLSVLLMRFEPTRGVPSLFTPAVIQNGQQFPFTSFDFYTSPSSGISGSPFVPGNLFIGDIFVPTTVVLQQGPSDSLLVDENAALTLVFDGLNGPVRLNLLAKGATPRLPLSRRGGVDLDGQGSSSVVLSGIVNGTSTQQLTVGRLIGTAFQWTNIAAPGSEFRLLGPVDFDGNGKSDLPMLRETPLNGSGQGSAQFWPDFAVASVVLRDVKPAWDVQAVGDLDGDGFGDLVWRFRGQSANIDDQGVSYIWFTNGTSVSQVRKRGGAPLNWTLLGAADLNADGAADMVYVSPTNTMRALMATPNRTCGNLNGGSIPAGFTALKLADFTGQGRGDVLIRNAVTGEVRLIGLNATGLALPPYTGAPDDPNASCTASTLSVTQTNFNIGTAEPTWALYVTGDFNGDGIFDIVWKRPDNSLTVWLMAANGAAPAVINNAGTAPTNTTTLPLQ